MKWTSTSKTLFVRWEKRFVCLCIYADEREWLDSSVGRLVIDVEGSWSLDCTKERRTYQVKGCYIRGRILFLGVFLHWACKTLKGSLFAIFFALWDWLKHPTMICRCLKILNQLMFEFHLSKLRKHTFENVALLLKKSLMNIHESDRKSVV